MSGRLRPSEVKAIAAILDEPAEDVTDLAKHIIRTLDELRHGRKEYVVTLLDGGIVSTWGPYDTVKQAVDRCGKFIIASKSGKRGILTILHRDWDAGHDEEVAP
jgi:hypothetical protein